MKTEDKIINILNNVSNDIWVSLFSLMEKLQDIHPQELEHTLNELLQKRIIRITFDDFGDMKLATESNVESVLTNRVHSALKNINAEMLTCVEREEYEEAAKLRDLNQIDNHDELYAKLLEEINSYD